MLIHCLILINPARRADRDASIIYAKALPQVVEMVIARGEAEYYNYYH